MRYVCYHGTLLQRLDVPLDSQRLINGIHNKSWFSVASLDTKITTAIGGRQGCKLGCVIFNSVYEGALAVLRCKAEKLALVSSLDLFASRFWMPRSEHDQPARKVANHEIQYADDGVSLIFAQNPQVLLKRVHISWTCCRWSSRHSASRSTGQKARQRPLLSSESPVRHSAWQR